MNVYQCVAHFAEEAGLHLLIDSLWGEEGADGGFPLPDAPDGGRQALVFDESGLWMLSQSSKGDGAEDHVRYFPFDVVTSCMLRQGPSAVSDLGDSYSFEERTGEILRATTLDLTIAESVFRFDGRSIAQRISNDSFFTEILDDFFDIVRCCATFGVPVELVSTGAPVMAATTA